MTATEQVKPVWKCRAEGCGYTAAPTEEGYRKVIGHQLAHAGMPKEKKGYYLVDENTGEILAQKIAEAVEKGLIKTEPPKLEPLKLEPPKLEPPKLEPPKLEEKPPEEPEKPEEVTKPQVSTEGIFRYTITLPADAFVLFNIAKAYGLETDSGKLFDEWVWDCIRWRFEKDYKRQLVLAPVEV